MGTPGVRPAGGDAGAPGSALCRRHNAPLDAYCCTDGQVLCAVCASAEHGGHRFGFVGEERRRKQVIKTNK